MCPSRNKKPRTQYTFAMYEVRVKSFRKEVQNTLFGGMYYLSLVFKVYLFDPCLKTH